MRRLEFHPYFVFLTHNKIKLCTIKDDAPHWFAGDFYYYTPSFPLNDKLRSDIAKTLGISEKEVDEKIIYTKDFE